ncbi:YhhA family cyclophane-containing RiPP [Alcaligenes faecalis]|uniref:YhhA family cyclophane-containing RiPP n=1 Tax=Alcaligenes faecalis TaxID=511 RepID=UPI00364DAB5B
MSKEFFDLEANTETSVFHSNLANMDVPALSSAALARLVEEVRHDDPIVGKAYDRTHNRHNR